MTPPVQPQRAFDPESVTDWINVLHNASSVPQDAPDYADARSVVQQALGRIQHLNRSANAVDRNVAVKGPASTVASTLGGLAHGASLGLGEPIAGAIDAVTGGSFREGAGRYREGMDRLEASNPRVAATAELAGMFAPAAIPARAAVGGVQAGRALGIKSALTRTAQGVGTGAVIGGVGGFSSGGEDPGDFGQRFDAAQEGALLGGAAGGILTGAGLRWNRLHAERAADLEAKGSFRRAQGLREELLKRRLDKMDAPTATEIPVVTARPVQPSAELAAQPAHPDIVRAVRDYEAGKISGTDLRTAMDVARGRSAAPPSPPPIVSEATRLSPSQMVDQLPAEFQTGRGTGGAPIPPRPSIRSPAELVDAVEGRSPRSAPPMEPDMVNAMGIRAAEKSMKAAGRTEFTAEDFAAGEAAMNRVEAPAADAVGLRQTLRSSRPDPVAAKYAKTKAIYSDAPQAEAKVVPAGPYQKAAPSTRMQSPDPGAARNADWLATDSDALRQQYDLAEAFGGANPGRLRAIAEELARRGIQVGQ